MSLSDLFGGFEMWMDGDLDHGLICIAEGAVQGVPVLMVLLFGRERMFHLMAIRFERARAVQDGAFIAELLDTAVAEVGQSWWVHRQAPDARFELFDARRNWRQGVIEKVTSDEFVVAVSDHEDDTTAVQQTTAPTARVGPVANITNIATKLQRPGTNVASMMSVLGGASQIGVEPKEIDRFTFSNVSRGLSADELMSKAVGELRCIDWANFSRELMTSSSSNNANPEQLYDLSRPVRSGERVDFFMSHRFAFSLSHASQLRTYFSLFLRYVA